MTKQQDANDQWGGDIRLLYPSQYLGAPDLRGKAVTVTIASIKIEEVTGEDGKSRKGIMRFSDAGKPWIINKTNLRRIASLYGPNAATWAGKQVTLYPTACRGADGTVVECVRAWPSPSYVFPRKDTEYDPADAGKSTRDARPIKPRSHLEKKGAPA